MILNQLGDDVLLSTISLDGAAIVLALDHGRSEVTWFPEAELKPFKQTERFHDQQGREYGVWKTTWEMAKTEPIGSVKRMRDRIRDALCSSIKAGELKCDRLRIDLDGVIDTAASMIDGDTLYGWAISRDIELGDLWYSFADACSNAEDQLRDAYSKIALQWQDPELWATLTSDKTKLEQPPTTEEYLRLLVENERLKAERHQSREGTVGARERTTFLKIIAALTVEAFNREGLSQPFATATELQRKADLLGLSLGDDTIAMKIKEAAKTIPPGHRGGYPNSG